MIWVGRVGRDRRISKIKMMITIPKSQFKDSARQFIKTWTQLLSSGKFQEAADLLDQHPGGKGNRWTAESLFEAFLAYGASENFPEVNNPFHMGKEGDALAFYKYRDGSGWAVEYDLPLNGERSDLTARFSFKKLAQHAFAVHLDDLRVL